MKDKVIVSDIKSNKEYQDKYNYRFNFNRKKLLTEKDLKKFKKGKFYKLDKNRYVKLPLFTKKTFTIVASATLATILIAGIATPTTILYMPHNVTLKSNHLEIVGNKTARMAGDYKCTFKIKDDAIGEQYMNNIDVDNLKVSVKGKQLPPDAYSFVYQTNAKNELTINKNYLKGDVEIEANIVARTQSQNCFFFEYDIDKYVDFDNDVEITYPVEDKQGGVEAVDLKKTKSIDDIYLKESYDVAILSKELLKQIGLSIDYNILILREDNAFKMNIKSKDDKLPKNIWLRSNARYTKKDEDFTIKYSDDLKSATIEIPYFFIRDNGSFRTNPDVEA